MMNAPATRGFSLIEILVAVLILGFALVGLTQAVTTAVWSNKDSELLATAALLAAAQIETLRAESYLTTGSTEGQGTGGLSNYSWNQTVSKTDMDGLYEVEVVVNRSGTGEQLYALKTMLFDPPLTKTTSAADASKDKRSRKSGSRRQR